MELPELISLAKVISRNKIKQVELVTNDASPSSKVQKLYQDLQEDRYQNDQEGAYAFFGRSRYRNHYFNRLKRRLRDRLINTLFLIDTGRPNFSDIQRAYYSCYRYAVAVKILVGGYSRKAAVPLARYTLRKAEKYEFTDIILMMANVLRFHYGAMEGEENLFRDYDQLIQRQQRIFQVELELEGKYTELAMYFSSPRGNKSDFSKRAARYAHRAEQQLKALKSYRLGLYGFSIITMQHQISVDHERLLRDCDRALQFFREVSSHASPTALFSFSFKKIPSLIMLGEFDQAEATAAYCAGLVVKGRTNYFKVMEYQIILYFHARKYEKASCVLEKAYKTPGFSGQTLQSLESWKIYDAYLYLLYEIGETAVKPDYRKGFRLHRFMNEVPRYSKDKRGANVTILVLQVLFLLQQSKQSEIVDRMEPLKTYTYRYLRKDATFRSNCFLKMLILLPACGFNKKAVLRRSAHLQKRLEDMPLSMSKQNLEAEIVPFEHLWEITIGLLD